MPHAKFHGFSPLQWQEAACPASDLRSYARFTPDPAAHVGRADILRVLLDGSCPTACPGSDVLKPLWVDEGMHRALAIAGLVGEMPPYDVRAWSGRFAARLDYALACGLAASYQALSASAGGEVVACSPLLRRVVVSLTSLFGNASVRIDTDIERMALSADKRRALVLTANELVVNALTHAFRGGSGGRIGVSLRRRGNMFGVLQVADNGAGYNGHASAAGIAVGLARVLDADLSYAAAPPWRTMATLVFPLAPATMLMQ